jgi:predicted HTH transcriptional regulator
MKNLPERQKKIVEFMQKHKKITRKECIEILDIVRATANRELSELQRKKLIRKIEKGKHTHYVLI